MTVNELRETLSKLQALLQAADAKATTTKSLAEFIELTQDFGDLNLKAFVKLAETGRSPAPQPSIARVGPGARAAIDAGVITREVSDLYNRAADPSVTEELMRATCGKLSGLKKDEAVAVAVGVGLEGMKSKKKDEIIGAITSRLLDRKGAAIRGQLIHRPTASVGENSRFVEHLAMSASGSDSAPPV